MDKSDRLAIVYFTSDHPACHFERIEDAVSFLTGTDPRCVEGAAWLEIRGRRTSPIATSMRPPLLPQPAREVRVLH